MKQSCLQKSTIHYSEAKLNTDDYNSCMFHPVEQLNKERLFNQNDNQSINSSMRMKLFGVLTISILLLFSCKNEMTFSTGFDASFKDNSFENRIFEIDESVNQFSINGNVFIDSGYVKLYLIAPTLDTIWKVNYANSSPVTQSIDTFSGRWKFGYISYGKGKVNVNINYK